MKAQDWTKWTLATVTAGITFTVSAFSIFATEKTVDVKINSAIRENALINESLEHRLNRLEDKIDNILDTINTKK